MCGVEGAEDLTPEGLVAARSGDALRGEGKRRGEKLISHEGVPSMPQSLVTGFGVRGSDGERS